MAVEKLDIGYAQYVTSSLKGLLENIKILVVHKNVEINSLSIPNRLANKFNQSLFLIRLIMCLKKKLIRRLSILKEL